MLPRTFRLMASSPKRILVPPNKRALDYPDLPLPSSNESVSDVFGPEWPPKRVSGIVGGIGSWRNEPVTNLSSSALQANTVTVKHKALPTSQKLDAEEVTDSSSRSENILRCIASQPSVVLSRSTVPAQILPKHSKENAIIQSASKLDLDPPIAHPLLAYSYKDQDPTPSRVYIRREEEANELVEKLSSPVGFDIEWKVIFRKGAKTRPVATVQLSDQRTILIVQISAMKAFPAKLKELLEDAEVAKVGVNILNDGNKLARDYDVRPQGLIELGGLARQADVRYVERYFCAFDAVLKTASMSSTSDSKKRNPGTKMNLATITTMYTGRTLCKGPVRISDWEVQPLAEAQLEYAANDAHSALIVYQRLIEIAKKTSVVLNPKKYTSGVRADYHRPSPSGTKARSVSRERISILQAPALTAAPSASSTSSSTSTSTWDDNGKSSSLSTSASSSIFGAHTPDTCKFVSSTLQGTNPAIAGADIGSLKVAECCETGHSVSQVTCASTVGPDEQAIRRVGPRFKPSYNNSPRPTLEPSISSTNESSLSSPVRKARTSAPDHSSLERNGRFKPSYNKTMSGFTLEKTPTDTSSSARSSSTLSSFTVQSRVHHPTNQRPQHIRAYNLWHICQFPLPEICGTLRSRDNPLKTSTVITYVVSALQTDPRLHFSRDRLKALLASEPSSWLYYRDWFHTLNVKKYINMDIGPGTKDIK